MTSSLLINTVNHSGQLELEPGVTTRMQEKLKNKYIPPGFQYNLFTQLPSEMEPGAEARMKVKLKRSLDEGTIKTNVPSHRLLARNARYR